MPTRKNAHDKTSAARQTTYLETLKKNNGKRVPVDLDAERLSKIDDLLQDNYGVSVADVIRRAVDEIHAKRST
jgi:hypothetical protein